MFLDIILNILVQLLYFIGVIVAVGFIIALLNRLFYKVVNYNRMVCYATGFLGTPIHELGHALFCVIFLHKINEIKLFQIDESSGTLGYVNHSYNPKNIYHLIGNYFIGIAPILCGTVVIYLATRFMLPTTYTEIASYVDTFVTQQGNGLSWSIFANIFVVLGKMVVSVFSAISQGILWWVYILLVFCISLHMNLSGADIKGSLKGLPFVVLLIVIPNLILGFAWASGYRSFVHFMNVAGSFLMSTLLLSLIFSAITVAIGAIVRGIMQLFGLVKRR